MKKILDKLLLRMDLVSDFIQVIPVALLAAVIFSAVRLIRRRKLGRRAEPFREGVLTLFVCYLAGLLNLTIVPQNLWGSIWFRLIHGYSGGADGFRPFSGEFSFVPTLFSQRSGGAWVQAMLMGNVAIFIPLGLFLGLTVRRVSWKNILPIVLGASLCIELFQPIVGRSFDVDDLICNTLGGMAGFLIYLAVRKVCPRAVVRCRFPQYR